MVGAGGDDAGDEVVLQLEDRVRVEGPVVGLRPEVGAGRRVDQLHRDAQLPGRLPEASLHHVARADLAADRPHVGRAARVARGRAAGDHAQVGEAGEAGHDVLGQALGQGLDGGVGAAVREGQDRDPEALVPPSSSRRRRGRRRRGRGLRRHRRDRRGSAAQVPQGGDRLAGRREAVVRPLLETAGDHPHAGRRAGPSASSSSAGGASRRMAEASSAEDRPWNGRRPVAIS